ncbi:MCE family protein [Azospirillum melinis]|uniref:MCE family protein n=1 Tax=Azospirillum melinis TaxID=328839 RepID=A0ABX2KQD0_9PROT|nr:MlaD family protein [Azospirillum melinis]MBP2310239.1 paraquat-inducible protein B [Azospirillum melinis]NUB02064.1 MCE family protein [Azospirillum melinis]
MNTDTQTAAADPSIAQPEIAGPPVRDRRHGRVSLVWIIPIVAALIGLSLVAQAMWQRGPTVTVTFASAEGIEPGKTKVKYKNVDIGDVTGLALSADRTRVVATIGLAKDAAPFAVAGSRFWVVRPRMAGSGISGLGTLLSGAYIGVDGGQGHEARNAFVGEEEPPVVPSDMPGRRFILHADDVGSLDIGSPVFFRRVQVGHVESFALDPDGRRTTMGIFVKAPYERFVTTNSRFWHASGVDLRMDASGLKLETQSLATILLGGIAFESPDTSGSAQSPAAQAAEEGAQFNLAADRVDALKPPDGAPESLVLHFQQSIRGLSAGAPVDFRGVEIGQVRSVSVEYDPAGTDFVSSVRIDVYPQRLGRVRDVFPENMPQDRRRALLADLVQRGMRAQLRSGNLLTGQLYVAVDFFPQASPAQFDPRRNPMELPTVPGDLQEMQQQVQNILRKLDTLPFDTLGQDAHRLMVATEATVTQLGGLARRADHDTMPEVRLAIRDLRQTLATIQGCIAGDSPLLQEVRQALRGVADATRSVKALTDGLDRSPESLLRGKKETTR